MRGLKVLLALCAVFSSPALACRDEPELRLSWLKTADLVVVAHVSNYRVEPDFLEINGRVQRIPNFARIDVRVEEVLRGIAPETLEVTWDTSWFQLPGNLEAGSYLIALWAPGKYERTLERAKTWTVLSPVCERSFLIPSTSEDAAAIREHLRTVGDRSM